jgi:PAS domain S-box-containing protein
LNRASHLNHLRRNKLGLQSTLIAVSASLALIAFFWSAHRAPQARVPIAMSAAAVALMLAAWGLLWRAVMTDIVGRRRAEVSLQAAHEALRQANEALQTVFQAAPLAIFALDLEGNVASWNPAAERMFGWSESEALGRRLPLVEERDLEAFQDRIERGKRGLRMNGREVTPRRKDGTLVEISLWASPLRDASGAPSGFIALAADISERKLLEERLRQSQKMEAVGRLAGGVAHDFNNLLTVITGYGYMLLDDVGSAENLRASVEEILRTVERASALTTQLLAFSRHQVAQPVALDLTHVVARMDRMLRRVIGEDIELIADLSPGLGKVKADPAQIEQVILNLVVNARDAMPSGGKIVIHTANYEIGPQEARTRFVVPPGPYVLLSVSDTGQGMTEETKAHLFEPFFTTKEQGKGTGLGMSTVYAIVQRGGGEITVSSRPDEGATIGVYLPRVEESAEAPAEAAAPATGLERGSETVLLVEDEDGVRKLVHDVLTGRGYTVLQASCPNDALDLSLGHAGKIDLLVTDVVMPQMSGRVLAERLAAARPEMKLLFISGYSEDGVLTSSSQASLLRKPFTPAALSQKVRQILDNPPEAAPRV